MKITDDRSAKLKAWAQGGKLAPYSAGTAVESGFFWTGLTGFTGLTGILNRQDAKSAKADFIRRVKRRINYSSSDMQVNVRGKPREHILRLAYLAP